MRRGESKRRQKALNGRTQRKQTRREARGTRPAKALHHIRRARDYPIKGCFTYPNWTDSGITTVVVARRQPNGNIVFGSYLVDYYCMGLKNAVYETDIPSRVFYSRSLPELFDEMQPHRLSPATAHELIYGSIEYAARFGFRPHRNFRRARYILDPADAHPRSGAVTFGHNGKPLYVEGPYDKADAIIRQLNRTVGEGNYSYIRLVGGSPLEF